MESPKNHIPVETLFIGCERPPKGTLIIEPFAGDGETMEWIGKDNIIIPYDSEPVAAKVMKRNVLADKPKYYGSYVITRVPNKLLSKSNPDDAQLIEKYGTDNIYKCFMKNLNHDFPSGGIIVLPIKFLSGTRDSEIKRRNEFFRLNKPNRINIFNNKTIVINFAKRYYSQWSISEIWSVNFYPEKDELFVEVDPQLCPHRTLPSTRANNKIRCCFGINSNGAKSNIYIQQRDSALRPLGLYLSDESQQTNDITPIAPEDYLYVGGFMSKTLQKRLCEDFNAWIKNDKSNKLNTVFPYYYIAKTCAWDLVHHLLWSYYKKGKSEKLSV
jgi:hypothetical protein